jgi:hypothetical protein
MALLQRRISMPLVDKLFLAMVVACFVGFFCIVMTLSLTDLRLDKKRSARQPRSVRAPDQEAAVVA